MCWGGEYDRDQGCCHWQSRDKSLEEIKGCLLRVVVGEEACGGTSKSMHMAGSKGR